MPYVLSLCLQFSLCLTMSSVLLPMPHYAFSSSRVSFRIIPKGRGLSSPYALSLLCLTMPSVLLPMPHYAFRSSLMPYSLLVTGFYTRSHFRTLIIIPSPSWCIIPSIIPESSSLRISFGHGTISYQPTLVSM